MKYLLIPEQDWLFFRDHSDIYETNKHILDEESHNKYLAIRDSEYEVIEKLNN